MDYRHGSHTVYQIEYHFVWVTKYRYKVLTGEVADRVRALVRETCEAFEIRIISGGKQGSCAYTGQLSTDDGTKRDNEAYQGAHIEQAFRGVSSPEKEILGQAFLGKRIFLRHGRPRDERND